MVIDSSLLRHHHSDGDDDDDSDDDDDDDEGAHQGGAGAYISASHQPGSLRVGGPADLLPPRTFGSGVATPGARDAVRLSPGGLASPLASVSI